MPFLPKIVLAGMDLNTGEHRTSDNQNNTKRVPEVTVSCVYTFNILRDWGYSTHAVAIFSGISK